MNLHQFSRKMMREADRFVPRAIGVKKQVATAVLTTVVPMTPIDTGRARFNWNVSMNVPNHEYEYDSFEGHGRTSDWIFKFSASRIAILSATKKDVIYISNGLPYIQKLNRGWSPQAPEDYVRTAAILGARMVRKARLIG